MNTNNTPNAVRPELVKGPQDQKQARFLQFEDILQKLNTELKALPPGLYQQPTQRVALTLAKYILDNANALSELKLSCSQVPKYVLFRCIFEATFKLAYLVNNFADKTIVDRFLISAYKDDIKANEEYKSKDVNENKERYYWTTFWTEQIELLKNKTLGNSKNEGLHKFDQLVCDVVKSNSSLNNENWYAMYRHCSGYTHARITTIEKEYTNEFDISDVYSNCSKLLVKILAPALVKLCEDGNTATSQ
ncbi:MAG: hypothetical protein RLZZ502_990 [Pseudomonadota bacterium]